MRCGGRRRPCSDAAQPHGADGEIAPSRHRPGCIACPQLGGVLGEGGVADVVQGLDLPVVPDQLCEPGGGGLLGGQAGHRVDGGDAGLAGLAVGAAALDLDGQAPGKGRLFTVATLIRRIFARPWPLPRVRP